MKGFLPIYLHADDKVKEALLVLKEHWNDIAGGVSDASVRVLNASLWSRDIYDGKERDAIDAKSTADEKMSAILKALEKKTKRNPAAFDNFLEVLREESAYSDLADKLEDTRGELTTSGLILLFATRPNHLSHTCT